MHSVCFAGLQDYPRIAVMEFSNDSMVSDFTINDTRSVTEWMVQALVDCGRFNVIESLELSAILNEHHLNMTGLINPDSAAQIGKLLGVQYLVIGNIVAVSNKESEVGYSYSEYGSVGNEQHQVFASVSARIVEIETGRIVMASRGMGRSTSTKTEISFNKRKEADNVSVTNHTIRLGTETFSSVQIHNALFKATIDCVEGKSGFVAKMDGKAKKR